MIVRYDQTKIYLSCYMPMPFFRSARIEVSGAEGQTLNHIGWSVRYAPYKDPPSYVGCLHATYRDHPSPHAGKDLVLLDTRETKAILDSFLMTAKLPRPRARAPKSGVTAAITGAG